MPVNPQTFFCIDGHTCGNPVRLVAGGAPALYGNTMSDKRKAFIEHYDWIRQSLMFEPRGHDMMSGAILYPAISPNADIAIVFMETSGCLPMCGHGAIGAVTMGLEQGLIQPRREGVVVMEAPAGEVRAEYKRSSHYIDEVRLFNVASYLAATDIEIECPGMGPLRIDVAYGGNFYAIIDPQTNYLGLESLSADDILRLSVDVRRLVREKTNPVHPHDDSINGVSHVMWTGAPRAKGAHARNAVFYGDRAIDRSPCGTGTSARMAQWVEKDRLKAGEDFVHESIIGSCFHGRVESLTTVGDFNAIMPSFSGWARMTGLNTIFVDERDPLWRGFQVT